MKKVPPDPLKNFYPLRDARRSLGGPLRDAQGVFVLQSSMSEQNIKVLLKLFQKLATGCGGEEPPQAKRNAKRSPRRGEQTERADHPVDGPPERFCGPPGGAAVITGKPFYRKAPSRK